MSEWKGFAMQGESNSSKGELVEDIMEQSARGRSNK